MKFPNIKTLIIYGLGIGCHLESKKAYEKNNSHVDLIHFNQLLANRDILKNYQILNISGGFMHGDLMGSAMCAVNQLNQHGLVDAIWDFATKGGVVYGQCNGFQLLVKSGLLPAIDNDFREQVVTLAHNDCGNYRVAYVPHKLKSKHFAFEGLGDKVFHLWCRHGEGKLQFSDSFSANHPAAKDVIEKIRKDHVLLEYADSATGDVSINFPDNPNGSEYGIAGLQSLNGQIFGQMAHPEVSVFEFTDPQWFEKRTLAKRTNELLPEPIGNKIISNIVNHFR